MVSENTHQKLEQTLSSILGEDAVITDKLEFYSSDIFGTDKVAALLIQPGSAEELAAASSAAIEAGYSVVGRGGATSYTGGLNPDRENSVMVDTARLNRILEIRPTHGKFSQA